MKTLLDIFACVTFAELILGGLLLAGVWVVVLIAGAPQREDYPQDGGN